MASPLVRVAGIREAARAFRRVDKDIPKSLRAEFLPIAERVAAATRGRIPSVSGRAEASVRPRASQRGAAIAFGGTAAPYLPWLDFGGSVGRGKVSGRPWSGSVKRDMPRGGRYVYPTIEDHRSDIEHAAEEAVVNVARANGFEVH